MYWGGIILAQAYVTNTNQKQSNREAEQALN